MNRRDAMRSLIGLPLVAAGVQLAPAPVEVYQCTYYGTPFEMACPAGTEIWEAARYFERLFEKKTGLSELIAGSRITV